jgi:hypothetical protein
MHGDNTRLQSRLLGFLTKGRRRKSLHGAKRGGRRLLVEPLETRRLLSGSGVPLRSLPPVIISPGVADQVVSLSKAFRGVSAFSQAVRYNVTADSNSALFAAAPFALPTGDMLLQVVPGATGAALLTVEATDTRGHTADAALLVYVAAPIPPVGN